MLYKNEPNHQDHHDFMIRLQTELGNVQTVIGGWKDLPRSKFTHKLEEMADRTRLSSALLASKIEEAWQKPRVDDAVLQEMIDDWKNFAELFFEVNGSFKNFFRKGADKTLTRFASDPDPQEVDDEDDPNPKSSKMQKASD